VSKRCLILVLLALSSTATMADTISGSAGAGWQSWTNTSLNQNGIPYWDGTSSDGAKKNIGYCLTGAGSCGMSNPPGNLSYWGFSNGAADPNITFNGTGGSNVATMQIEIAGYANLNQFGYMDSTGMHVLFTGSQGSGATTTFTAIGSYVFFIISGNGQTYFTNSSLNPSGDQNFQHFAVFGGGTPGVFYLGIEDLPGGQGDKDYNDMVVKIAPTKVPEPGSVGMLAMGLAVLMRRAQRKARG